MEEAGELGGKRAATASSMRREIHKGTAAPPFGVLRYRGGTKIFTAHQEQQRGIRSRKQQDAVTELHEILHTVSLSW